MHGETFTIGELAQAVTDGNERAIRKMLNSASPPINQKSDEKIRVIHNCSDPITR